MKVLNKHKDIIPAEAVYVGRGSPWGNPFIIGKDGDRMQVIHKYQKLVNENMLSNYPEFYEWLLPLKDKDLVCFCAPLPCHADILKWLANGIVLDAEIEKPIKIM